MSQANTSSPEQPRIDLKTVMKQPEVIQFTESTDDFLEAQSRIQHDESHAILVANLSREVLQKLGYHERECELAAIAGYLHDIGNMVNRYSHGFSGALITYRILSRLGMDPEEIAQVISAIGNHEENTGGHPVNPIAAAVILADKSNVHRSRVRKCDQAQFTTRDRVNFAAENSELIIDPEKRLITIRLQINPNICSVMEYFEIYLVKMMLCRRAAQYLGCQFELLINDSKLL